MSKYNHTFTTRGKCRARMRNFYTERYLAIEFRVKWVSVLFLLFYFI